MVSSCYVLTGPFLSLSLCVCVCVCVCVRERERERERERLLTQEGALESLPFLRRMPVLLDLGPLLKLNFLLQDPAARYSHIGG